MDRKSITMKERPVTERPYEKCLKYGAESLTDGELLAVLLRSGTKNCSVMDLAYTLLNGHPVYRGLAGLYHWNLEMLKKVPGIGNVKAIEVLCMMELSKRLSKASLEEESDFSSPEYIAAYYMEEMRHLPVEKVKLLLLDGRHRLMKEIFLSKGTANSAWVPVRNIFVEALRYEAVYIILIHNHPSGCPEPSREDLVLTRQVKEAGELLGIPLSDHIIIGNQCYTSLRERDMM
ncbi:MAG: DNA repair protein RadC [Eubacterium sp.]|nr:DNA repair protein RadC [Eubacterium sp.]MDD7209282.1 DNA repair protein RadC [Lachnospiraceae bacterium]MDY5497350.1 DNA repair protein RadC [Anaerobutyricum sp.]